MKRDEVTEMPQVTADEANVEEAAPVGPSPLELFMADRQPETDSAVADEDPATPTVAFAVPSEDVCIETWKYDASPNGLIKRVVAHFGNVFSFRPAEDAWLRWDGKTYITDHKNMEIMDAVRCVAESIVHIEAALLANNHPSVLTLQQELKTAAAAQSSEEVKEIAAQLRSLKRKLENDHQAYGMRCQQE
ncbi:MAG TPA: hypothetical protein VF885_19025, partial [Arthrobacter sp.]